MTKSLVPLKAQTLDDDEHEAWFAGRIPRRLLAIPFGGPIPSVVHAKGVDLDYETFTERTDIFGPHRALRQTRERLVDFQHSYRSPGPGYGDPTGMMTGHLIGKSILDPDPDEDGWWVDLWVEAGNKRVALIKRIAERGTTLYGSSQPLGKTRRSDSGEILEWPFWLETLSTAPQNTYSVMRPKAALDALDSTEEDVQPSPSFYASAKAALLDLSTDLRQTFFEEATAGLKAGRVHAASDMAALNDAMAQLQAAMEAVQKVMGRQPDYTPKGTQ